MANTFRVYLNSVSAVTIADGVTVTIQAGPAPAYEGAAAGAIEFLQAVGVGHSVEVRHRTGTRSCMNKPALWDSIRYLDGLPEDTAVCRYFPLHDESGYVGINESYPSGGLYVIPGSGGFSCLGFDVALNRANAYRDWIKAETGKAPEWKRGKPERGQVSAYEFYLAMCKAGRELNAATGKRCPAELTPALIGLEGKRVETTGHDGGRVRFTVGRSMGWSPIHLIGSGRDSGLPVDCVMQAGAAVRAI